MAVHRNNPSEKEEITKEEADQEASQSEGTNEAMAPRPASDVLESCSESKNLSLDELSANTNGMLTTLLPEASKDDEEHEGVISVYLHVLRCLLMP